MNIVSGRNKNAEMGVLSTLRIAPLAFRSAAVDDVLAPAAFEYELRRQRACADRSNSCFVMLSFSFDGKHNLRNRWKWEGLARIIRKRSRLSDIVGWDGAARGRIGVILTSTDTQEALNFVEAIDDIYKSGTVYRIANSPNLLCNVFEYPGVVSANETKSDEASQTEMGGVREIAETVEG